MIKHFSNLRYLPVWHSSLSLFLLTTWFLVRVQAGEPIQGHTTPDLNGPGRVLQWPTSVSSNALPAWGNGESKHSHQGGAAVNHRASVETQTGEKGSQTLLIKDGELALNNKVVNRAQF
jgi:hypothetical protein